MRQENDCFALAICQESRVVNQTSGLAIVY